MSKETDMSYIFAFTSCISSKEWN